MLQAENTQVVVYSQKGMNNTINLLFGTSHYDLKQKEMPHAADVVVKHACTCSHRRLRS